MKLQSVAATTGPFTYLPVAPNVFLSSNKVAILKVYLEFGLFRQISKSDLSENNAEFANVGRKPPKGREFRLTPSPGK